MSAKRKLVGNSGNEQEVNEFGASHVIVHHYPITDLPNLEFPFTSYFKNSSGSNDMKVNGSTTNVAFYITSDNDYDIYLKRISVEIGDDNNPALNDFGDISTGLTNGVQVVWSVNPEGDLILHDGIKTNKEFIRFGTNTIGFGDGTTAFLADVSGAGAEKSYLPIIDFTETFGMVHGLRLKKGSKDKISFIVRDDLTGLTTFNIIATGKKIK